MNDRPRLGSREWHADFERRRRRFDRMWPWMMVMMMVSIVGVIVFLALITFGHLPVWLLFV